MYRPLADVDYAAPSMSQEAIDTSEKLLAEMRPQNRALEKSAQQSASQTGMQPPVPGNQPLAPTGQASGAMPVAPRGLSDEAQQFLALPPQRGLSQVNTQQQPRQPIDQFALAQENREHAKRMKALEAGDFSAGLKTGWEQTKGLGYLAAGAAGQVLADKTDGEYGSNLHKWGIEGHERTQAAAEPYQVGRTTKIEDVGSLGEAGNYLAYTLGQVAPSVAESVLAGVIGAGVGAAATPAGSVIGAAGGMVGKGALKKFMYDFATKRMANGMARKQAEKAAGAAVGAGIGTFVAGYQMGVGDIYGETLDEQGRGNTTSAFVGAIPYAAVEAITDMTLAGNILKGAQGAKLVTRIPAAFIKGGMLEGSQELSQEAMVLAAGMMEGKEYSTEEVLSRLGNGMAAGFIAGGAMGGAGGIRRDPNFKEVTDENGKTKTVPKDNVDLLLDRVTEMGPMPRWADPNQLRQAVTDPSLSDDIRAKAFADVEAKLRQRDPIFANMWHKASVESIAGKRPIGELLPEFQQTARNREMLDQPSRGLWEQDKAAKLNRRFGFDPDAGLNTEADPNERVDLLDSELGGIRAADPENQEDFLRVEEELANPATMEKVRNLLPHMVWSERGGMPYTNDEGEYTGDRSKWIPKQPWWWDKPDGVTEKHIIRGLEKFEQGKPLNKYEREGLRFITRVANTGTEDFGVNEDGGLDVAYDDAHLQSLRQQADENGLAFDDLQETAARMTEDGTQNDYINILDSLVNSRPLPTQVEQQQTQQTENDVGPLQNQMQDAATEQPQSLPDRWQFNSDDGLATEAAPNEPFVEPSAPQQDSATEQQGQQPTQAQALTERVTDDPDLDLDTEQAIINDIRSGKSDGYLKKRYGKAKETKGVVTPLIKNESLKKLREIAQGQQTPNQAPPAAPPTGVTGATPAQDAPTQGVQGAESAARPYASDEDRSAAIQRLSDIAAQSDNSEIADYGSDVIKATAEYGAPESEILEAIQSGNPDALEEVSDKYYRQSGGMKQGFGVGTPSTPSVSTAAHPVDDYKNWESLTPMQARELARELGVKVGRKITSRPEQVEIGEKKAAPEVAQDQAASQPETFDLKQPRATEEISADLSAGKRMQVSTDWNGDKIDKQVWIENLGPGNGWVVKERENSVTMSSGGDPRGGGFTREEAIAKVLKDYDNVIPQQTQQDEQQQPAPEATQEATQAQTTEQQTDFSPADQIKIAADSIEKLRKADVERALTDGIDTAEQQQTTADYIRQNRPDLAAEVDELMADSEEQIGAAEDFSLTGETESEIKAREEAEAKQKAEEAARKKAEDEKAAADAAVDSFTLSGSDREADLLAAAGQKSLFGPGGGVPDGPSAAQTASEPNSTLDSILPPTQNESVDKDALFDSLLDDEFAGEQSPPAAPQSKQSKPRTQRKPRAPRTAGQAASSAVTNTAKAMAEGAKGLIDLFDPGKGTFGSGLVFNEETYAKAKPHFIAMASHLKDAALDVRKLMQAIIRALRDQFGMTRDGIANMKPYIIRFADEIEAGTINLGEPDVQSSETDQDGVSTEGTGQGTQTNAPDGTGAADDGAGSTGQGNEGNRQDGHGDSGVSGNRAGSVGARGRGSRSSKGGKLGSRAGATGDRNDQGGDGSGAGGLSSDWTRETPTSEAARGSSESVDREQAAKVKIKAADLQNVKESLPQLLPSQQEDVVFAERRFEAGGRGVLFTNGTGTGKTYSGLGIIARQIRQGKGQVLIVAPSEIVIHQWIKAAKKDFGIDVHQLTGTADGGIDGVNITTYANFYQNAELVERQWDMLVHDEAHKLMENKAGEVTSALAMSRALTGHPGGAHHYAYLKERGLSAEISQLDARSKALNAADDIRNDAEKNRIDSQLSKKRAEFDRRIQEHVANRQVLWEAKNVKRVDLSATPFAYEKSVDMAEGFLFDYPQVDATGYNQPNGQQQFMMEHFGYRMRTGKLTEPGPDVDRSVMQRQFNRWLKEQGALSGRALDVDFDYSREFVAIDDLLGNRLDEGFDFIREMTRMPEGLEGDALTAAQKLATGYRSLESLLQSSFDYHERVRLLEAIKAPYAASRAKEHIALGRKVVVFHSRIQGGSTHPFQFPRDVRAGEGDGVSGSFDPDAYNKALDHFIANKPELYNLDLGSLQNPIALFQQEFGDRVTFYNGTINKRAKAENPVAFNVDNDENGKYDVIVVLDEAGKEGINLNDATGKHQRALINIGLPVKPTLATQIEGRIYRVGQKSDAIIEYLNTGTNFERWTFAQKIAERASAAENLAMGDQARRLRDSFVDAFENPTESTPNQEQGKGGKETDRAAYDLMSPFEEAKTHYFANQRTSGRRNQREGIDYYQTPEPIGLKMVEWAGMRPGEAALEPSAGHGAIARYFPENVRSVFVELERSLISRLALRAKGTLREQRFEDLNVGANKFNTIVMNPPYGQGGAQAMSHLAKAMNHLNNGGRIVALLPDGPSANKKLEQLLYGKEGESVAELKAKLKNSNGDQATEIRQRINQLENFHTRADFGLPSVTFGRAGTSVKTHIVIIDRVDGDAAQNLSQRSRVDLEGETINELFDDLENRTAPERIDVGIPDAEVLMNFGLQVKEVEEGGFYIEGKTFNHRQAIGPVMRKHGGYWDKYTKKWQAASSDPTADLAAALQGKPVDGLEEQQNSVTEQARPGVIEHRTQAGKVIRGVVRSDISKEKAKAIDPYTFKKDGGWFIREKHLNPDGTIEGMDTQPTRFNLATEATESAPATGNVSAQNLQAILDQKLKGWEALKSHPVIVVQNERQLPDEVRQNLKAVRQNTPGAKPRGVYMQGKGIYLVANNLSGLKEATLVVAEELAHHGLRAAFGNKLDPILKTIAQERPDAIAQMQQEGYSDPLIAAEEYLAHMARLNRKEDQGLLQRVYQVIRQMLRSIGIRVRLSDGEIRSIVMKAERAAREGGQAQGRSTRFDTTNDKRDADYLAAVKRGDMETAQRMVNEAAEASGLPVFSNDAGNVGYKVRRSAPPKKTVTVYKAFRMRDGKLYPMFVGAKDDLPIGLWLDATEGGYHFTGDNGREYIPADTGVSIKIPNDEVRAELLKRGYIKKPNAKSIKVVAYRPGWHGGELPFFPQAGNKVAHRGKKLIAGVPDNYAYPNVHEFDTVIAEVEMDADRDYKPEYINTAERNADGSINKQKSGLRFIPKGGFYEYATNPLFADRPELGKWFISGSVKINRIIPQAEVNARLDALDVPRQAWNAPKKGEFDVLNLDDLGYDPQFNHLSYKLLDPVTYDDAGNVIPLSQRFDRFSTDPRFSFAGQSAKTADIPSLEQAKQRLDAGDDAETVRQETGWFMGDDDKPRFEINDSEASFKQGKAPIQPGREGLQAHYLLGDILDHPRLFEAYPEMANVRVATQPEKWGSFNAEENMVRIGTTGAPSTWGDEQVSVIMHELQHKIQRLEGFAVGGNPDKFAFNETMDRGATDAARERALDFERKLFDGFTFGYLIEREHERAADEEITYEEAQANIEAAEKKLQEAAKRDPFYNNDVKRARQKPLTASERYHRLSGEVEARNVQARRGMSAEQRRATSPEQTRDVPREDVIIVYNGREMASVPLPDTGLTAYHSTSKENLESILKDGFKPSQDGEMGKGVYLIDNPEKLTADKFKKEDQSLIKVNISGNILQVDSGANKPLEVLRAIYGRTEGTKIYDSKPAMSWVTKKGTPDWVKLKKIVEDNGYVGMRLDIGSYRNMIIFDPKNIRAITSVPLPKTVTVDGIERPTTNSNGQPIHSTREGIENFWRWFGDSKVVDEQGRPLVVHHGAGTEFTVFDQSYAGFNTGHPTSHIGFFFAPRRDTAAGYAGRGTQDKPIVAAYLAVQNPAYLEWQDGISSTQDAKELRSRLENDGFDGVLFDGDEASLASEIVAFNSTQIKSATGNTGTFDVGNPDIRFNLDTSGLDETTIGALERIGAIQHKETLREKMTRLKQDAGKKLVQGIFDQYAPIKEIDEHAYMLTRQSRGTDGALEVLLQHGMIEMDDDGALTFKDDGKGGFFKLMAELNGEHDLFFGWIAGNRADQIIKDAKKAERQVNFLTGEIARLKAERKGLIQTGGAYQDVRELEQQMKEAAQLRNIAKKRAAVTERNLDAEQIKALKALNQGAMKDGRDRAKVYADTHQRFNEMLRGVMDIAEKSGLIDGESRQVWEKDFYVPFYRQIEEGHGGPTIKSGLLNQYAFKQMKGGQEATKDLLENTIANWRHLLSASAKNIAAQRTLEAAADLGLAARVPQRRLSTGKQPKNLAKMRDSGQEIAYEVYDPLMLDALKAIDFSGFDSPILKGMAKFKRWLTIGVTSDPAFKFWRNMLRDAVSSMANAEMRYDPIHNARTGLQAQGDQKTNATMLAGGALFRFGAGWEGERAIHARKKINKMLQDKNTLSTKEKMQVFLTDIFDPYQEAGDKVENMQRAALYKKLRSEGESHLVASYKARDLMDFSLNGSFAAVRMASMLVPFMNARLQGLYKLARAGRADPRRMTTVLMAAGMVSVGLLLAYREDDDWKRREDWDRENYWWFKIGDKAMRIPKPFELGAVATMFERMVELGIDDEMDGERFAKRMQAIVTHQLSMSPIPQALQPMLDIYANKDAFTGRPIEGMAMEKLQKRDRYHEGTSEVARQAGKLGVLSPVQIDHLVRGYFGWLGASSMTVADWMARPMLDRPERPSLMTRSKTMGVLEDLSKDPQRSRYVSQFYDDSQRLLQAYESMREAEKRGETDRAEAILVNEPDLRRRASIARKVRVQLSNIRKQKREVERSDISRLQKQRRLYQLSLQEDKLAQQIVPRLQE